MQEIFQDSLRKMQAALAGQKVENPLKYKYTLRKVPCWGERVAAERINFEWPTQAMLDQMPPGVSLKSLHFKLCDGTISSVKCTLTNGIESPVFENPQFNHYDSKTIEFDPKRPVRAVSSYDLNGHWIAIRELRFLDGAGSELYSYNPLNRND